LKYALNADGKKGGLASCLETTDRMDKVATNRIVVVKKVSYSTDFTSLIEATPSMILL